MLQKVLSRAGSRVRIPHSHQIHICNLRKLPASPSPQHQRRFQFGSAVELLPRVAGHHTWNKESSLCPKPLKPPSQSKILPSNFLCLQVHTRKHFCPHSQFYGQFTSYLPPELQSTKLRLAIRLLVNWQALERRRIWPTSH